MVVGVVGDGWEAGEAVVGGNAEPVGGCRPGSKSFITHAWIVRGGGFWTGPVYLELSRAFCKTTGHTRLFGLLLCRTAGPNCACLWARSLFLQGIWPLVARARGLGPFCRTLAPGHPGDVPEFGLPGLAPNLLLVTRQGVAVPVPGRGPLNFTVF